MFVANVLISAATAPAKVRAFRIYTMRRAFFEINKVGLGELLLLTHDFSRHDFTVNRERSKDRLATITPDAFAAECDVQNSKIDDAQRSVLA